MGNEGKNGKVPLISKIAYGFGDVGCNFSWMFVSNFLAACCSTHYGSAFNIDILGTSGLARYGKGYLYDYYILPACTGIHMCKYSVWNTLRCDDTGH